MALSMDEALFGELQQSIKRSVARLELEEDTALYALSEFDGKDLRVTVSDGARAWRGCLSVTELGRMAREVKWDVDQYIKVTLKALTRENIESVTFSYSSKPVSRDGLALSWKKYLEKDDIRFELGSIQLDAVSSLKKTHCEILDHALGSIGALRDEMCVLQSTKSSLEQDHTVALKRLTEYANLKESLEKDLYGKFRLILNDKKAKIRRLLEELEQLSEQNHQLQASSNHGNSVVDEDASSDLGANEEDEPKVSLLNSGKKSSGPVKRRRREPQDTGPKEIPLPPSLKSPDVRKRPSETDSMESDKLLELL